MADIPGRRLLGPAVRERLLGVQARRRPRAVDARRPVGRAELVALAGQHLRRAAARSTSIRRRRQVVKLVADKVIPPIQVPAGQRVRAAVQVPEPVAHEVLGTADLPRRHGAAAARLQDVDDQLSGQLHPGPLRARARRTASTRARRPRWRGGGGAVVPRRLAVRQLPARHRRHLPASDAVLRRLVRRQLASTSARTATRS